MENMIKLLPVGVEVSSGHFEYEVEMLESNGVSERVFADKTFEKPYTWLANVFSVALKRIGEQSIGEKCREEFLKTRSVTHHPLVLQIPIADANSLIIWVHIALWQNVIREQEAICKYCGQKMLVDIDLERLTFSEQDQAVIDSGLIPKELLVSLQTPFIYKALGDGDAKLHAEYDGESFNTFCFRIPTLVDAIRHEKEMTDPIIFWRKIALDCLKGIWDMQEGTIVKELPITIKNLYGVKFFDNYISTQDLKAIRKILRDGLPSLQYFYEEECINKMCRRMTPVSFEASDFFSD